MALVRPTQTPIAEPAVPPDLGAPSSFPGGLGVGRPAAPLLAPVPTTGLYLRRCTFRRLDAEPRPTRRAETRYAVTCLYPDYGPGIPLGDLASARVICEACVAKGIFRPDEY